MTVKEMLIGCNIEQAAALHYELQEPPKCEDWARFLQAHKDFISEIGGVEPVPGEYVILGSTAVSEDKVHHSIHMYSKTELLKTFRRCEAWEQDLRPEQCSVTELERLVPDALGYVFPNHYDMELMPWEELLGVDVFEGNLDTFGHDLLAALIIREMSFWGFSIDHARQGQKYVWDCLQEFLSTQIK